MDTFLLNLKIICACMLIFLSFGLVGARFSRVIGNEQNDTALNPLYGWAVSSVVTLALAPWLSGGALIAFLLIMLAAGILMFGRNRAMTQALSATFFAGAVLLFPLLYGLCTYPVHLWDDASHWLPNAHYLFQYGRFPSVDGPINHSAWPGYPYGYTSLIASVGWIVGSFVETVGPLLNLFLLMLFASFLARHILATRADPPEKQFWPTLRLTAALFAAITLFNPGLFSLLLFSAYAEYATAVVLGFLLFTGWQYCQGQKRDMAIAFAMLAILFVQIKQANVFLLVMLAGSLWVTTRQHTLQTLKGLLFGMVPAFIVHGVWEFYKSQHLPGLAFTFKPFQDWQWFFLPALFHGMAQVALENVLFFGLLAVMIISAIVCAFKKQSAFHHLVMSFALLTLGYIGFLTLAYIGSRFSDWEITSAASFFRYMSQLQCAAMTIVILKCVDMVRAHGLHSHHLWKIAGNVFIILIPLACAMIITMQLLPQPEPSIQQTRDYAHAIFANMPPQGKVGLIGTNTDGSENTLIRFEWCQMASPQFQPELTGYVTHYTGEKTVDALRLFAERFDAVMVAPHDDLAMKLFGLPPNDHWVSFKRQGKVWEKLLP